MESLVVTVHQTDRGVFRLRVDLWSDGAVSRTLLQEESHPQPGMNLTDVWGTCQALAGDALEAAIPRGLWAGA